MTYGRSLERYLKHLGQARVGGSVPAFTEWATLAQDRAGWRGLMIGRPFDVGMPRVLPSKCDTRVLPEDMRQFMAQRATEVLHKTSAGERHTKKADLLQRSRHPLRFPSIPALAHAHPHLNSLHVLIHARCMRVYFCSKNRLQCHLGLY
jgi:hypothetical protein